MAEKDNMTKAELQDMIDEMKKEIENMKDNQAVAQKEMTDGMKQALLERNLQKAMMEAKQDMVDFYLPLLPGRDDEEEAVCGVNGVLWKVRRGETVKVPRCVAEVFQNADKQKLEAMKRRKGLQKKSEKNNG
jgi:hypothetical protein